jgi:glycosyltransferase involved in cell wall biosynthesis
MKLSVVLPCFNGASTIAVQLEALSRQDWAGGWEVIVVDNGSTDDSMAIVQAFRDRLPGLAIVTAHVPGTPRLGVPHSYNTGIAAAGGDALVFCEADDEVAPGWLAAMGRALAEHDFVAARLDHRKLNPEWLHPREGEGYQSVRLSRMHGYPFLSHASGCSFGLRRAMYEQVGPLDTKFPCVHDTEYSWRAQLRGFSLHLETDALVHYREKQRGADRFRQGRNWGRDYVRLLQHYGAPPMRFAVARRLLFLARLVPRGLAPWVAARAGNPKGRHELAQWAWNLGWSVGECLASIQRPAVARSDVLAHAVIQAAQDVPRDEVSAEPSPRTRG